MRAYIFFLLFVWSFVATTQQGLFAEEVATEAHRVSSVIDNVINAYGGKETIEAIQSMHIKGNIEAFMLHDSGTYELYFKRERKLRVETKYGQSSEVRILNGERGYRGTNALPVEEVFGPRYFSMVYHFKHLDILHDLVKRTYQIQSMGKSRLGGRNVEVFHLNDKDGAIMDISIDLHKFFILKVTGYFREKDKHIDLSVEFSDFRKVHGAIFPFRITNYAGGLKTARTIIDEYFLNSDIPDFLFEPAAIQSL